MNTEQIINIEFPVEYVQEGEYHVMCSTDETKKYIDIPIVVQADSKEEAIRRYWLTVKFHLEYLDKRSRELDRWKPFQKGNWKHIGGTWFTFFGLNVYFRYGKNMKHGFYLPFTKLNISFFNHWKKSQPLAPQQIEPQ